MCNMFQQSKLFRTETEIHILCPQDDPHCTLLRASRIRWVWNVPCAMLSKMEPLVGLPSAAKLCQVDVVQWQIMADPQKGMTAVYMVQILEHSGST